MESFTPVSALVGGALIGAAAVLLMWLNGRIAGISGIFSSILTLRAGDRAWRLCFVAGLVIAPLVYTALGGALPDVTPAASWPVVILGGFLVGVGTQLGGGCTSGHGVCGMSRLSARSIAATVVFMTMAGVTVFIVRHSIGG